MAAWPPRGFTPWLKMGIAEHRDAVRVE